MKAPSITGLIAPATAIKSNKCQELWNQYEIPDVCACGYSPGSNDNGGWLPRSQLPPPPWKFSLTIIGQQDKQTQQEAAWAENWKNSGKILGMTRVKKSTYKKKAGNGGKLWGKRKTEKNRINACWLAMQSEKHTKCRAIAVLRMGHETGGRGRGTGAWHMEWNVRQSGSTHTHTHTTTHPLLPTCVCKAVSAAVNLYFVQTGSEGNVRVTPRGCHMKTHNCTCSCECMYVCMWGLKGYARGVERMGEWADGDWDRGTIAAVAVVETVTMFSRVCKQL